VHHLSGNRTSDPRNRVDVRLRHWRIDQRNRAYNLHKHNIWLYSSQTPKVGLKLKSLHLRWTLICVFGTRSLAPHTGRHTNAHDILQNVIVYCCAVNIYTGRVRYKQIRHFLWSAPNKRELTTLYPMSNSIVTTFNEFGHVRTKSMHRYDCMRVCVFPDKCQNYRGTHLNIFVPRLETLHRLLLIFRNSL